MGDEFFNLIPEMENDYFHVLKNSGHVYLFQKMPNGTEMGLINSQMWEALSHDTLFNAAHVSKVLLAGLGLGYDTWKIRDNPEIETIHVVEKSQELINMLGEYTQNEKVTYINDHILNYLQTTDHQYDLIWIDIFPADICYFMKEEAILREAAHSKLKPNGKILFWRQYPIQAL